MNEKLEGFYLIYINSYSEEGENIYTLTIKTRLLILILNRLILTD